MLRRVMFLMVDKRQQEAVFEGKVSPEAPRWLLMKRKVLALYQKFQFQSEVLPVQEDICYSGDLSLLPLLAFMEAVQIILLFHCSNCFSHLFFAQAKPEYIIELEFPLHTSCPLQPSNSFYILYLRFNLFCQHSLDKYI